MTVILIILIILTIISWSACVFMDFFDRNPFLFIWVLSLFFVYIPLYVSFKLELIGINVVNIVLISAILSHFVYIISALFFLGLFNNGKYRVKRDIVERSDEKKSMVVMYLGIFLVFIIFIINGIGISEIMNATFLTKRELGNSSLLILITSSVVLAQSYHVIKSKNVLNIVFYSVFFIVIVAYYKSRSIIILALLPLIYYLIFFTKKKKYKIGVLIVGPLILIGSQLLRSLRHQGSLLNFDSDRLFVDFYSSISNIFIEGDFAVINVYFNIIRDCDSAHWCGDFTLIQSLLGLLTQLQGTKTLEYYLYDYYIAAGFNGSLHPTFLGFLYGDTGGFIGCTFFMFLGFLRSYISKFILDTSYFFLFIGFVMYFSLFFTRGSVYNSLVFLLMSIAIVSILNIWESRKVKVNHE